MENLRITDDMNAMDILMTMSDCNPGALNVLMKMMESEIGFMNIVLLDSFGIYGSISKSGRKMFNL